MKLSCLQENLSKGLAVVSRAVATRSTLPVTQNVLISTDQSRLKLSATNLEIAITTWIGASIEDEGAITLPARILTEFVNTLEGDKIDFSLPEGNGILNISSGRSKATINGIDAEEFPPIPTVLDGIRAVVNAGVLKKAISRVAFAAATEESRPVLTGVELKIEGNDFSLAAADGFRLAVQKDKLTEPIDGNIEVIIPARTMNELNRLVSDDSEEIEVVMTPTRGQILFRSGDIEIVSQLLQGNFPNYQQLLPEEHSTRSIFDTNALQRAVRSASIFARDGSNIVRMQLVPPSEDDDNGKALISARSEEVGDNEDVVDAESLEGEESKIAFNSRYLMDVLAVLDKGNVVLETTTASSPGVFKPVEDDGYTHVVMPMFVQW
ncbi:MAG: DNA polymerase III subunit beta [SAR202 cluster bacterium]|nr:DNA polymerase III subunit beta [SAR202 cluster bacterium]MQG53019.1 DNA polymerase III subunit beta [SAR202 cluster bacterium]MQG85756.1 DNA polymerase III subunit beta [SAR202 cluster bacterium]|tara:strand:- start:71 stop:1210 length:1140 start_codon:yes stop_codon:yes gene_type:complete